jgi:hypothetical protein
MRLIGLAVSLTPACDGAMFLSQLPITTYETIGLRASSSVTRLPLMAVPRPTISSSQCPTNTRCRRLHVPIW